MYSCFNFKPLFEKIQSVHTYTLICKRLTIYTKEQRKHVFPYSGGISLLHFKPHLNNSLLFMCFLIVTHNSENIVTLFSIRENADQPLHLQLKQNQSHVLFPGFLVLNRKRRKALLHFGYHFLLGWGWPDLRDVINFLTMALVAFHFLDTLGKSIQMPKSSFHGTFLVARAH